MACVFNPYDNKTKAMKYLVLLGRILFAAIFLNAIPGHFSMQGIQYAAQHNVPWPNILVPAAGLLLLAGGLSIVLGYKARIGAWMLVAFLIPVTFYMHDFWNISDTMMRMTQMSMFMKNISLLGASFLITYFGAGPLSMDAARNKPKTEAERKRMAA
jgi:putative oxidoreductase